MCKEVVEIEQTYKSELGEVHEDLQELQDSLTFLQTVTSNEDVDGLIDINGYNNGKRIAIEGMSIQLKNIMDRVKSIGTNEEDE